jgi:hypothetical protein
MTMQEHIDLFQNCALMSNTTLHGVPRLSRGQINLALVRSLGPAYEVFQETLGDEITNVLTNSLYAKAKDCARKRRNLDDVKVPATTAHNIGQAYSIKFKNNNGPRRKLGNNGYNGYSNKRNKRFGNSHSNSSLHSRSNFNNSDDDG